MKITLSIPDKVLVEYKELVGERKVSKEGDRANRA